MPSLDKRDDNTDSIVGIGGSDLCHSSMASHLLRLVRTKLSRRDLY